MQLLEEFLANKINIKHFFINFTDHLDESNLTQKRGFATLV